MMDWVSLHENDILFIGKLNYIIFRNIDHIILNFFLSVEWDKPIQLKKWTLLLEWNK